MMRLLRNKLKAGLLLRLLRLDLLIRLRAWLATITLTSTTMPRVETMLLLVATMTSGTAETRIRRACLWPPTNINLTLLDKVKKT